MAIRARFKVSSKRDGLVPIHWTPVREVQSFFFSCSEGSFKCLPQPVVCSNNKPVSQMSSFFDKCYQRTNVINPFGKFFMSVLWACVKNVPVRVVHSCD